MINEYPPEKAPKVCPGNEKPNYFGPVPPKVPAFPL